ncbi:MAG: hypothetical protein AAFX40_18525 [Cyanobacteria bacterium J06639_1]
MHVPPIGLVVEKRLLNVALFTLGLLGATRYGFKPIGQIASNEVNNCRWLQDKYPNYTRRTVYPITRMRSQIEHLVGIAGYNLFWECAYYQIPCALYPSTWHSDSTVRMQRLGDRPYPDSFANGAPLAARAIWDWWRTVR